MCFSIVQENVDLLSFSSLSDTQQICNSQGLPLKAVYRDSVVGIRYLHPLSTQPNSSPVRLLSNHVSEGFSRPPI